MTAGVDTIVHGGRVVTASGKSVLPGLLDCHSEGVAKRNLPMTWMACVMAENPARVFGLYPGIAGFTFYEGWPVRDRPRMTLVRGQTVPGPAGVVEQKPGVGRYLSRGAPRTPLAGGAR